MRASRTTRQGRRVHRWLAEPLESRLLLAAAPAVPTGQMIADLNLAAADSIPRNFTAVGDTMFFAADDGVHGAELWATDGTPSGTRLVKDIDPRPPVWVTDHTDPTYPQRGHASPSGLTAYKGALYFFADDGVHGMELWRSDGTEAGSVLVKDMSPGKGSLFGRRSDPGYAPVKTAVLGDTLYFSTATFFGTGQLWKTDGTAAGTVRVNSAAGPVSTYVGPLAAAGGNVYFVSTDAAHGQELWRTDGTQAGTGMVSDLSPGPLDSTLYYVWPFAPAGHYVYFRASIRVPRPDDPTVYDVRTVIYRTDGTDQGTVPLANSAGLPVVAGGRAYFNAGGSLQVSDPVNGTTTLRAGDATALTPADDRVFFVDYDEASGYELWTSDGTPAGTRLVKDLAPGVLSGMPVPSSTDGLIAMAALGSSVVFTGADGHVYRSDGTPAGTTQLSGAGSMTRRSKTDLTAGYAGTAGGRLFFDGWDPDHGEELWVTDGTAAGTVLVADLNTGTTRRGVGVLRDPEGPVFSGGSFYFASTDDRFGGGLWRTDGTAAGTVHLTTQAYPTQLIDFDGAVYFRGYDPATGLELWKSDGTPDGTGLLKDLAPGRVSGLDQAGGGRIPEDPRLHLNKAVYNGALYVGTEIGNPSAGLWRTDGTEAGTVQVDPPAWLGSFMAAANGTLYLQGYDPAHGYELWVSDGRPAGMRLLADLTPGTGSTDLAFVGSAGGVAYFYSNPQRALIRSDGTPDGTYVLTRLPSNLSGWAFIPAGDAIYFADSTNLFSNNPVEHLWRSDGTVAGTQPLTELLRFPGWFLGSVGNSLLYFAGSELWRTDGTTAGTYRVRGGVKSATGPSNGFGGNATIMQSVPVNGRLYFIARHDDPAEPAATRSLGSELWVTDGTEEGTYPVPGFAAAPAASIANQPIAVGNNQLMVLADDGVHGMNPWLVNLPAEAPTPAVANRRVFYNNSSFDGRSAAGTPADLGSVAPDKVALRPGQAASFANVTSYARGINGVLIDFAGAMPGALGADDFEFHVSRSSDAAQWEAAPASAQVVAMPAPTGAVRYAVTWADGAVKNAWLRVTVKADAHTGLAAPDVFYFGNLVGETNDLRVTAADYAAVRMNLGRPAPAGSRYDFDRNGRVDSLDLLMARANLYHGLAPLDAPAAPPPPPAPPVFASGRIAAVAAPVPNLVQQLADDSNDDDPAGL